MMAWRRAGAGRGQLLSGVMGRGEGVGAFRDGGVVEKSLRSPYGDRRPVRAHRSDTGTTLCCDAPVPVPYRTSPDNEHDRI